MTCDGSPGSPGVETIPAEDGPEKLACLGCSVCKPWNYAPFRNTVDIPPAMQGQLEVEEAVRGLAWAKANPDAFKNADGIVPCRSTRFGPGCGHNTLEHIGPESVNADCDCCTWRLAPLPHATSSKPKGMMQQLSEATSADFPENAKPLNRAQRRAAQGKGSKAWNFSRGRIHRG